MNNNAQKGAGLIEVLVTVLILASSLLAMGALQNRSLQFNHSAYLSSQANIMAYDILDRIRINHKEFTNYNHGLGDATPTGSTVRAKDIREWLTSLERNLPGGKGGIQCVSATKICTVTVQWVDDDRLAREVDDDVQETANFVYSTRI